MMKLPVASFRPNQKPTIRFKRRDQFFDFHRDSLHRDDSPTHNAEVSGVFSEPRSGYEKRSARPTCYAAASTSTSSLEDDGIGMGSPSSLRPSRWNSIASRMS